MPLFTEAAHKSLRQPSGIAICLLLLALASNPSLADDQPDLEVAVLAAEMEILTYEVSLGEKPVEKIFASLDDGLPTRVGYAVELWQRRARWFDRLVAADFLEFTIRYDPWADEYLIESVDLSERVFTDEADLAGWLSRHGPLEFALDVSLEPEKLFYLAIGAHVEPLGAEQVGAVERWLGGDDEEAETEVDTHGTGIRDFLMDFINLFAQLLDSFSHFTFPCYLLATDRLGQ